MPESTTWQAVGMTDIGQVRSVNQDSILVDNDDAVFIVADGMGGHAGGEIASSICTMDVQKHILDSIDKTNTPSDKHPRQGILDMMSVSINRASTHIYERALEDPSLKGMGTTATAAKIIEDHLYVGHVGDSRLYLVRCGVIYQMTLDHSLVDEQVRAGILTEEEARNHHLRNVITRSVGYQEEEYVDTFAFPVMKDDLMLLCSDGLHTRIEDREIAALLKEKKLDALKPLIDLANNRGGDDNISVVIVKIG